MAIVYYPQGTKVLERNTASGSQVVEVLNVLPNNAIFYFDTSSSLASGSITMDSASYANSASFATQAKNYNNRNVNRSYFLDDFSSYPVGPITGGVTPQGTPWIARGGCSIVQRTSSWGDIENRLSMPSGSEVAFVLPFKKNWSRFLVGMIQSEVSPVGYYPCVNYNDPTLATYHFGYGLSAGTGSLWQSGNPTHMAVCARISSASLSAITSQTSSLQLFTPTGINPDLTASGSFVRRCGLAAFTEKASSGQSQSFLGNATAPNSQNGFLYNTCTSASGVPVAMEVWRGTGTQLTNVGPRLSIQTDPIVVQAGSNNNQTSFGLAVDPETLYSSLFFPIANGPFQSIFQTSAIFGTIATVNLWEQQSGSFDTWTIFNNTTSLTSSATGALDITFTSSIEISALTIKRIS